MTVSVTASLMAAKKAKGLSFADLESAMGLDEVWIASLFYGQATASKEEAEKLAGLLSLDAVTTSAIQQFPGIMSAIDFTLDVDKVEDTKGDRVKITMCGKFLPYKKW